MSSLVFLMLLQAAATARADLPEEPAPFAKRLRAGVEIGPALAYSAYYAFMIPGGSVVGRLGLQLTPMVAIAYQGGVAYFSGESTPGDTPEK
jgi:hypothetical protein